MAELDLVFEGGGAKGIAFVGALKALANAGHTPRRLVGTSAGAITATLVAAGYTWRELQGQTDQKPGGKPLFATFLDVPGKFALKDLEGSLTHALLQKVDRLWVPGMTEEMVDARIFAALNKLEGYRLLFSLIERGGVYSGEVFRSWIQGCLDAKLPPRPDEEKGLTLALLRKQKNCHLSLVATDTTHPQMLVLNHNTAPDCPVSWAVRMSMSIPFLWQEVVWRDTWGLYRGRDISGHTIVDGGVLSNFPVHLLMSTDDETTAIMGGAGPEEPDVLGLLIDESGVLNAPPKPDEAGLKGFLLKHAASLNTVERLERLINTMMSARDMAAIEKYRKYICRLPAQGYETTEFNMSPARRDALINAAEAAVTRHLSARSLTT